MMHTILGERKKARNHRQEKGEKMKKTTSTAEMIQKGVKVIEAKEKGMRASGVLGFSKTIQLEVLR